MKDTVKNTMVPKQRKEDGVEVSSIYQYNV